MQVGGREAVFGRRRSARRESGAIRVSGCWGLDAARSPRLGTAMQRHIPGRLERGRGYAVTNVPARRSSSACRISSSVFITKGP